MTAAPLTEQGAIRASFPAKLKPLFEFGKYRYKVLYGGRGGAKSWSIARALLLIASERKIDILCAREYQINIGNSVHELLKQQIEALGLTSSYSVTDTRIMCLATGSRFFFRGLHNNAAEIKSFEGVSLCWVEEAQAVSAASWDVLDPTIRKPGSEIWMSFNPGSPDDETWRRFVVSPPPNAWVQKISWKDNKWFNPTMNKIRLHVYHTDPERYKHIWDGEPEIISDAQVFKGRYLVQEFETPKDARFFQGCDWGFSQDPSVLIRCFIRGNVLYVDREAYGVGVELDETPQLFDSIETARRWPIKADSARPETISFMKRRGFKIEPAKKWAGSVEDGIAILKSFDKIIVHPRCVHAADEFYKYSYKVDKNNGDVLPIIVDANNHCVAAGTMIETERGAVPVEQVTTADRVLTREGYKRVLWAGQTGENRDVLEITAGGHTLTCTPEHLIYTINRGFVRADSLSAEDALFCLDGFIRVQTVSARKKSATVYDLAIDGQHEFFAEYVLVHNCIDALRYALDGYIHRGGGMKINLNNLRGR